MGAKQKKAARLQKAKAATPAADAKPKPKPKPSLPPTQHQDAFLPLDASAPAQPPAAQQATVLYIGHIPHGFYEHQMQGFFSQFGTIKRLRLARNRKTGKSKHYAFLEFANPDVAKVVAHEINNYLLFEHNLRIQLLPPHKLHPKLWKGVNSNFRPLDLSEIARRRHNKERTLQEHQKMVQAILKRDEKRRKRIKEAGIDYECPDLVGKIQPKAKRIKFTDDQD